MTCTEQTDTPDCIDAEQQRARIAELCQAVLDRQVELAEIESERQRERAKRRRHPWRTYAQPLRANTDTPEGGVNL